MKPITFIPLTLTLCQVNLIQLKVREFYQKVNRCSSQFLISFKTTLLTNEFL